MVQSHRERRSFGSQSAFRPGRRNAADQERILRSVADRVSRRMRGACRCGRTVTLRLRFADYRRATRSTSFAQPTNSTEAIAAAGLALLGDAGPLIEQRGLTLIGIAVSNLAPRGSGTQLSLEAGAEELDEAIDRIRERFGNEVLSRGTTSSRDRSPQDFAGH
jgi:DNA polymerase-4